MNYLEKHIDTFQREHIISIVTYAIILLAMPVAFCFLIYYKTNSNFALYTIGVIAIFISLVTLVRWKRYFKSERYYALKFINLLEEKTSEFKNILNQINENLSVTGQKYINFELDPTTFKIDLENIKLREFKEISQSLNNILRVNKAYITDLKKQGWDGDNKIDLSLELTLKWFSKHWNDTILDQLEPIASISIKDKKGTYNLNTNKWQSRNRTTKASCGRNDPTWSQC